MVRTPTRTKGHDHQKMTDLNGITTNDADRATSRIMACTTRWLQDIETTIETTTMRITEIAITQAIGKNRVPKSPSDQERRETTISHPRIS
jgi:hypothetical protein